MYYLLFIILAYIYLHNPLLSPLNGLGSIKLLYPLIFLFLFIYPKNINSFLNKYKDIFSVYLILIFYCSLRSAFGGDDVFIYLQIVAIIENLFLPYVLVVLFLKKIKQCNFFKMLLVVASVGSIISFVCIVFPSVDYFVRNQLQITTDFLQENIFRGFGLSSELTYSYGIIQGVLLSIGMISFKENKWFVFFMPFVFLSILLNARTGMLIPIFTFACIIIRMRKVKDVIPLLMIIALFLLIAQNAELFIQNDESLSFLSSFFAQLSDVLWGTSNADYNTAETLLTKMKILPDTTLQWFFGRGISLFLASNNNTDVGYYLQLNYGGMIYMLILFMLVYCIVAKIYVFKKYRLLWFILVFTILICNLKGNFIPLSGGFRLISLIVIYVVEKNKDLSNDVGYLK